MTAFFIHALAAVLFILAGAFLMGIQGAMEKHGRSSGRTAFALALILAAVAFTMQVLT